MVEEKVEEIVTDKVSVPAQPRRSLVKKKQGKKTTKQAPKPKVTQADLFALLEQRPDLIKRVLSNEVKGAELAKELMPEQAAEASPPAYRLIYAIPRSDEYKNRLKEILESES